MKLLDFALNILFPPRCVFCDRVMEPNTEIRYCGVCEPRPKLCGDLLCCKKCGKPIVSHGDKKQCYYCMNTRSKYFDRIVSVFVYGGLVKESIHRYKIEGVKCCAPTYATCMSARFYEEYDGTEFDFMCSAPSHSKKSERIGFNHTEELCAKLAPILNIPYKPRLLYKTRKTEKQSMLSPQERRTNLVNSVAVKPDIDIKGNTVLLVDDVCTTRATITECSRALKAAGAKRVFALTLATSVKSVRKSNMRR